MRAVEQTLGMPVTGPSGQSVRCGPGSLVSRLAACPPLPVTGGQRTESPGRHVPGRLLWHLLGTHKPWSSQGTEVLLVRLSPFCLDPLKGLCCHCTEPGPPSRCAPHHALPLAPAV